MKPDNIRKIIEALEIITGALRDCVDIETAPASPAVLAGETSETVADILEGAFRVVPTNNAFAVQRWLLKTSDGYKDGWTGILEKCGAPLWPWRVYQTEDAAEAAILEYGRRVNEMVTIVRHDGREIASAAPGSTTFPRCLDSWCDPVTPPAYAPPEYRVRHDGVKIPVEPFQFIAPPPADEPVTTTIPPRAHINPVTLGEGYAPEKDGVYKIKPGRFANRPGTINKFIPHWIIWRWYDDRKTWLQIQNRTTFDTYWQAVDWLNQHAKEGNTVVDLAVPSAADIARWNDAGLSIDAPDPVIMEGTPHDLGAAIAEGAAETLAALADLVPVIPEGTKLPVPIGEDLWKVEQWTALDGWHTVRDELTWDEVGAYLNPSTTGPVEPVIEVVPATEQPGMFAVREWTGKAWKYHANNVNQKTAEGVFNARLKDPERNIPTDISNRARKAISQANIRIKSLIDCVYQDDKIDKTFIIARLKEIIDILK